MAHIPQPRSGDSKKDTEAEGAIYIDTGPLLCFGHVAGGVKLLIGRYKGRLRWAQAVAGEIERQAEWVGRSRTDAFIRAAAKIWAERHRSQLGTPYVVSDRGAVDNMRSKVRNASRYPQDGDGDLGESETLVLAQAASAVALINESPARRVAVEIKVDAYCTLDVLAAEFQAGRIEWRKVLQMYEQLREANLDIGGRLPTPHRARQFNSWTPAGPA